MYTYSILLRHVCLVFLFEQLREKGTSEEATFHDVTYEINMDIAGVTSLPMTAECGSDMSDTDSIDYGNLRNMVTLLLY